MHRRSRESDLAGVGEGWEKGLQRGWGRETGGNLSVTSSLLGRKRAGRGRGGEEAGQGGHHRRGREIEEHHGAGLPARMKEEGTYGNEAGRGKLKD
eukprot:759727-Hanusia_phi.AAC.4